MTANPTDAAGDAWLTPQAAKLLNVLADPLPAEIRRDLAGVLRRVGASPDVVAASMRASIDQDYAAVLGCLPAFRADLEHKTARGTATPTDVEHAIADLARYHTRAAAIAARDHFDRPLGEVTRAELTRAQHVLNILQARSTSWASSPGSSSDSPPASSPPNSSPAATGRD